MHAWMHVVWLHTCLGVADGGLCTLPSVGEFVTE